MVLAEEEEELWRGVKSPEGRSLAPSRTIGHNPAYAREGEAMSKATSRECGSRVETAADERNWKGGIGRGIDTTLFMQGRVRP